MNRVFDTLIWKDRTGKFIPWLATSWQTPDQGRTWRFTLRPGIRWQDGQPLTARDVAFTFQYLQAHGAPPPASIGRPRGVAEARALSDTDVEIRMAIPLASFLRSQAGAVPIMPKHIWGSVSDPIAFSRSMAKGAVMGSGPYRLASHSPGQGAYDFVANESYFLGRPFVKRVLEIPNTNVVLGLKKGDIDAGSPPPGPGAQALQALKGDPGLGVLEGPSDFGTALQFNGSRGPLADPRVRQAIAYAIDRQDMVRRSLDGIGAPGNPGFFPPTNPVYNKDVPSYQYDPGKARALLDSAGYGMTAGGGRSGPSGPLRLNLLYSTGGGTPPAGGANDATNAALVASYLKAVGIAVQGQAAEGTDLDARTAAGQYEMLITTIPALGGEEIINFIFGPVGGGQGIPGFHNPEFTIDLMRQNVTFDPTARRKLLDRVQFIIADQLPLLMLYYGTLSFAFRRSVFDAWYFTPGGFAGGIPGVFNKQAFVTGRQEGTSIRSFKQ